MKKKTIYIILFCLILCFIWGNSMLSREVSGAISHFIADIFGGEQGATEDGHHFLRKLAHLPNLRLLGQYFGFCRANTQAIRQNERFRRLLWEFLCRYPMRRYRSSAAEVLH